MPITQYHNPSLTAVQAARAELVRQPSANASASSLKQASNVPFEVAKPAAVRANSKLTHEQYQHLLKNRVDISAPTDFSHFTLTANSPQLSIPIPPELSAEAVSVKLPQAASRTHSRAERSKSSGFFSGLIGLGGCQNVKPARASSISEPFAVQHTAHVPSGDKLAAVEQQVTAMTMQASSSHHT
ncbi:MULTISPECIES: hypothetical protein [unclassified Undibacterium]|uniref:hypothetical protein n=1 Tax=unclassified Undibacterium TaxID=2630295 RepID=UPI002AC98727|nr:MULTISPECIES: hypothetical protein [unclassified Undibacterium]MEB0140203.1 hypothetical protein [Undibacterium sp. CCC2.1]MEB0173258.1 hypothetical protein [Undibacterium sp. CCC1.1]MEB0177053.1 hypothetical protein [Undibacterium sp. CCC3.4]MEB0216366.1 hypothetical protein [Undibacterium sp. 5I2]WPX45218.1 hypothetical protein RHM61_08365 [Undibacterium sp. CCC3.4]